MKYNYQNKGSDLTKENFDKSEILSEIINKNFKGNYKNFFGEI